MYLFDFDIAEEDEAQDDTEENPGTHLLNPKLL